MSAGTGRAVLPARAKLNLFLEVSGKRPDGYHELESVFAEVDFADRLEAEYRRSRSIVFFCDDPELPPDEQNLAQKAALLLHGRHVEGKHGLLLRLRKTIPAGSGLGGGSSDAAAALRLANDLLNCDLSREELAELGAEIGSDVPFFLYGGVCLCRGRGERITPLPDFPKKVEFGIALPPIVSNTARAYANLRLPKAGEVKSAAEFVAALRRGDIAAMERLAFNRFEDSVFDGIPGLKTIHAELEKRLERPVRLSGSGSALWFFSEATGRDSVAPWRTNAELQQWARDAGVRLVACHAVSSGRAGEGV